MKSMKGLLTGALVALACFAVATVARSGGQPPTAFATEVSIEALQPTGVLLKAQLKDIQSGVVLAGPRLKMPLGETASTQSTLDDGTIVSLTATVDEAKKSVQYALVAKNGDHELASHRAKIAL